MIKVGNIKDINEGNDWFIGSFVEDPYFNTKELKDFEVKISTHKEGYKHPIKDKVIEDENCRSMVVCLEGSFVYSFLEAGEFRDIKLDNFGDFVYWTPDINHKVRAIKDSKLVTFRWWK